MPPAGSGRQDEPTALRSLGRTPILQVYPPLPNKQVVVPRGSGQLQTQQNQGESQGAGGGVCPISPHYGRYTGVIRQRPEYTKGDPERSPLGNHLRPGMPCCSEVSRFGGGRDSNLLLHGALVGRCLGHCTAPGFLDSGLTVFASTLPRPARRGRVAPGRGFDSGISPASTVRCMSA